MHGLQDEDERTELEFVCDELAEAKLDAKCAAEAAAKRITELTRALEEALAYFKDNYDVIDGEDGPRPNKEMRLGTMIDEALHGIRF